ncbi:phospholipid carrier-dependent glycosyltransferase [Altererythrobacter salegens]|uniref:Polyprenol-phosphate-mannose--protein mannosyltransferase n=1 Tax=Croceibacterium salegens TaxID=1737568 RepID=A0A6I4STY2_9SPHN|nr:glycosyltransferase family 39 protein [Croceibacterium salegens]MXO59313.1 phospholipid carrier-dependent glycosyltransferase [Croceibacterium salegens]
MSEAPEHPRDPLGWHVLVAIAFLALCCMRLTIPSQPFFDEVHYLPAARDWLALNQPGNIEHPPLGKELMALGIRLFGDNPLGWRIMSMLFGTLGLFASMRALWFASLSRFASTACGWLVATGFLLFVQSRIAMLDVFMVSLVLVALWALAGAVRENETGRKRLAIAGACLGFAMAAKWNAIPIAVLPGLAFVLVRAHAAGWRVVTTHRGAPVAGISTLEAFLWLGAVPLLAYAACYLPGVWFAAHGYALDPLAPEGIVALHRHMLELQTQQLPPHTYQSRWIQWIFDWRPIWYLYENADGAQRGVLMIGNPLTMLLGLPAILWAGWQGLLRGRRDTLAVFVLYAAALGMWVFADKPVQFYYHYLLPATFLLAALALALDEFWKRGNRWLPLAVLVLSGLLFAYYFPILTADALPGEMSFLDYAWLNSWR